VGIRKVSAMLLTPLGLSIAQVGRVSQEAISEAPTGAKRPLVHVGKLRTGLEAPSPLQSAEKRLQRFYLQSAARELLPRESVAKCLRVPIPSAATVDVYRNPEFNKASLGGLQVCASVWACPVCSSKITERKRIDLEAGLRFWRDEAGGYLLLVTFTLRHHQGDDLSVVLSALLKAFDYTHKGGWWQRFKAKHNLWGRVRALEVTYGSKGWHPHIHCLYFIGAGDMPAVNAFELSLKERWLNMLKKHDRDASWENGIDVRISDEDISAYVSKYGKEPSWKIEHEMTKSPSKIGKWHNKTAFQLLNEYNEGDSASGRLFIQYAMTFKGKSQLHWSKELRSMCGLDKEKTDEELAKEREKGANLWAQVPRDIWRVIIGNDALAELMQLADAGDADRFWAFVYALTGGGKK
jgi:hypothetical protein